MSGLDPAPVLAGAVAMTALFGAAAIHKLAGLARFRGIVADYGLLPPILVPVAAVAVPLLELAVAAAALSVLVIGNAWLLAPAAGMLLLYAMAMGANLARGRRDIDCGCTAFGSPDTVMDWSMVARNLGIAACVLLLAAIPTSPRPLGTADMIALAGVAAAMPLLYVAFGEWRALRQKGMKV